MYFRTVWWQFLGVVCLQYLTNGVWHLGVGNFGLESGELNVGTNVGHLICHVLGISNGERCNMEVEV